MRAPGKPRLAKLTRPRLHEVLARERLFLLLDACRQRPVTWVVGPPGSGKTALVGSYLETRAIPGVWYHLDADDQDLPTFFHYLSQSLESAAYRRRGTLPMMGTEHSGDIRAFARYYFREYFARSSGNAALVFDNYHELPADSALHSVLAQAALEMPQGQSMICVSREDPPAAFARIDALDGLARVDWPVLKLTMEEARSIAALRFQLDPATIQSLYEASQGWAAGLTLALERAKRSREGPQALQAEALESMFNYFLGQIFQTVEPEVRELLMRTAILKRVTPAQAVQLSGNANAACILESFYRRRLFTDRRGIQPYSYQYHDLFRAFLLDRLEQLYTPLGLRELRQRAASALESVQHYDEAFHLYREAQDWQAIARLVEEHGQSLLGQGRASTLRNWIMALPEIVRQESPWVMVWHGMALMELAPHEAITPLENAYQRFLQLGHLNGQVVTCAAAASALLIDMKSLLPIEQWIRRLLKLRDDGVAFPSVSIELQVNATIAYYLHQSLSKDTDAEA